MRDDDDDRSRPATHVRAVADVVAFSFFLVLPPALGGLLLAGLVPAGDVGLAAASAP